MQPESWHTQHLPPEHAVQAGKHGPKFDLPAEICKVKQAKGVCQQALLADFVQQQR